MSKELHKILNQTTCPSDEMLRKYSEGKLDAENAHAVEMHIVDCEMCTDELEGLMELHKSGNFEQLVKEIHDEIDQKVGEERKIVFLNTRWVKYAAFIILFIGLGFIVNEFAFFDAHETSQVADVGGEKSENKLKKAKGDAFPVNRKNSKASESAKEEGFSSEEEEKETATIIDEKETDGKIIFEERMSGEGGAAVATEQEKIVMQINEDASSETIDDTKNGYQEKPKLSAKKEVYSVDDQLHAVDQNDNNPGNSKGGKDSESEKSTQEEFVGGIFADYDEEKSEDNRDFIDKENRSYKARKKSLFSKITRSEKKKSAAQPAEETNMPTAADAMIQKEDAQELYQQKRYTEILSIYYYAQPQEKNADDIFYTAMSLYQLNKFEEAIPYFDHIIENNASTKNEALFFKAKSLVELNQIDEAREIFQSLINNNTKFAEKSSKELGKIE